LNAQDACGTIYALCRSTSPELKQLSNSSSKIVVVEDIDVTQDNVGTKLQMIFQTNDDTGRIPIDTLIHNAGAYGPPESFANEAELRSSQTLEHVTMDRMRGVLE
jgi:NADP-dependent 3-hydroxy acid dehydrogenase YdfG